MAKKPQAQVRCPNCGHLFRLDDQITAHIRGDWEKQFRARTLRELRQQAEEGAEKRVRAAFARESREKDEVIRQKDRMIQRLKKKAAEVSRSPDPQLGMERQETLQEVLAARFQDEFVPVPVGRRGADLLQRVRDPAGATCGSILWESKRNYHSWSRTWVAKLQTDRRRTNSDIGVIVSDVLPDGEASFCQVGTDLLACDLTVAPVLAAVLRARLIEVVNARGVRARREDLKGAVYDFISGPFVNYMRSIVEKMVSMKTGLDQERRAMGAEWKKRETEIEAVVQDLAAMYGSLKGIGAALPVVSTLELPALAGPHALAAAPEVSA